ncbi:ABC transporter ATP-binding protein [Peptoniphilus sp. GNH]|nr:ABC transporter ATP-binding protein [Peptoniphilus sp. GNH]
MIELKNLSKSYGKTEVLENINSVFEDGKIYGLIGQNGSGKTTLMKIIANHIRKYQGEVLLDGKKIANDTSVLEKISYVGDGFSKSNSSLNCGIKNIFKNVKSLRPEFDSEYANELLEKFSLSKNLKYKKLSTGNKTIVELIIGLALRSPISIFDEPSSGLDAVNRYKFYSLLMEDIEKYPRTVIISTHIIGEIENYLTDLKIIHKGRFILEDEVENVQDKAYKFKDHKPEGKNILAKESVAGSTFYFVYDNFTGDELLKMQDDGVEFEKIDLQKFFIAMIGGAHYE